MSAWIEITVKCNIVSHDIVALYMSAWIEIYHLNFLGIDNLVALYMSAWIEIEKRKSSSIVFECRTLHECVD